MNVVVTLEHRFERTPDGTVWTQTQYARPFWAPYLSVFAGVRVVARVRPVPEAAPSWKRADGDGVEFIDVPYYIGPWQYLRKCPGIYRVARTAVGPEDAVILRVPSTVGNIIGPAMQRAGRPYAVEVVGDPYDVFAPGSIKHPLRPFFRWWFPRKLRQMCTNASAAAYVTQQALQRRYPCPRGEVGCSDVEIPDAVLAPEPRSVRPEKTAFRLMTVVGGGKHRPELQARATRLGLTDRICFRGQLTAGDAVRRELDAADLFVLPSHQEGLPRAMVEAMARGLPCIGSTVGGIPELLSPEDMVPPGDSLRLAGTIRQALTDPDRLERMSARNLETAREYREDVLRERRQGFYRRVKDDTEAWLQRERGGARPCQSYSS